VIARFALLATVFAGCACQVAGQREIRLRFHVDPSFEGLVLVKEDPNLELEFNKTYDIEVRDGEVLLPRGFLNGPQPVFWRAVEVVDANSGRVLSYGNDPKEGALGVRNLIGLSGPGSIEGNYFVISDGRKGAFELAEEYRHSQRAK
jgi:hypothetical protein